jgi:hypothetical protein
VEVGQYDCIIFYFYIIFVCLPKSGFNINPGDDGMLEDPGKGGQLKKAMIFKGIGLKA